MKKSSYPKYSGVRCFEAVTFLGVVDVVEGAKVYTTGFVVTASFSSIESSEADEDDEDLLFSPSEIILHTPRHLHQSLQCRQIPPFPSGQAFSACFGIYRSSNTVSRVGLRVPLTEAE